MKLANLGPWLLALVCACSGRIETSDDHGDRDEPRAGSGGTRAGSSGRGGGHAGSSSAGAGGTVACNATFTVPQVGRLSRFELLNTLRALAPGVAGLDLPRDPSVTTFENEAAALGGTAPFVEASASNAEAAAARLVADLPGVLGCTRRTPPKNGRASTPSCAGSAAAHFVVPSPMTR